LEVQTLKYEKFKMACGCHIENTFLTITQQWISNDALTSRCSPVKLQLIICEALTMVDQSNLLLFTYFWVTLLVHT